jgi:excisionase family DNA binding protein
MDEWLTPVQAATYLQVTRSTVYRWSESGLLPFYDLGTGRGRRFRREDLDAMPKPPFRIMIETRPSLKHVAPTRRPTTLCGKIVNAMQDADTWNSVTHIPTCSECRLRTPEHVRRHFDYVRGIPL